MALSFELNDQQKELVDLTGRWIKDPYKPTWEISGPAGSGKTSVIREVIRRAGINPDNVLYMAYVGKAAMMLALNGNNAKTIHGSIYDLVPIPIVDENGEFVKKDGRILTRMGFKLKESLPPEITHIVVDEGSMVNEHIKADLLSFGIPIIVLGDLNQLPPVFGDPAFLQKPDYILTKIERQKEDDPIVQLSQMAIRGDYIRYGKYGNNCYVVPRDKVSEEDMQTVMKKTDIILCGRNSTRENINEYYRTKIMVITTPGVPVVGDKIICRQNNWKLHIDNGIYMINGLIGYIDNMYLDTYNKRSMYIDFRPEFLPDSKFMRVAMDYQYLFAPLKQANNARMSYYNLFQFAYAITAHLSQGSQYGSVMVYDEQMGNRDYYRKWLYTCITRAIHTLYIFR